MSKLPPHWLWACSIEPLEDKHVFTYFQRSKPWESILLRLLPMHVYVITYIDNHFDVLLHRGRTCIQGTHWKNSDTKLYVKLEKCISPKHLKVFWIDIGLNKNIAYLHNAWPPMSQIMQIKLINWGDIQATHESKNRRIISSVKSLNGTPKSALFASRTSCKLCTGLSQPLPIPQWPWSHIAVDFITDLHNSLLHMVYSYHNLIKNGQSLI